MTGASRLRSPVPKTAIRTTQGLNGLSELRKLREAELPTVVPRSSKGAIVGDSAADLARVVANWDRLLETIKAGLLAHV